MTAAATVGPRGAGKAYIDRSVLFGNRSRYSNNDVDVDNSTSSCSMDAGGDVVVVVVSSFRFVPAILCCLIWVY